MLVEPRRRGTEYRVDHARGRGDGRGTLYIVTDCGAPEFTLMTAPLAKPGRAGWDVGRLPGRRAGQRRYQARAL